MDVGRGEGRASRLLLDGVPVSSAAQPSPADAPAASCITTAMPTPAGGLLPLLPAPTGGLSFVTGGTGLVGWGIFAELRVTGADAAARIATWFDAWLSKIGGDVGGPICFVSLGFAPGDESVAIIPQLVIRLRDGVTSMTTIGHADPLLPLPLPITPPGQVRYFDPELSTTDFMAAVETAVRRIRAGEAAKVVLAHGLSAATELAVDERFLLTRLAERYPSCSIFAVDGLVGASPEMLIRRHGQQVSSRVLAGTAWPQGSTLAADGVIPGSPAARGAIEPRAGVGPRGVADPRGVVASGTGIDHRVAADLMASEKDLAEHRFAAESVADALRPVTSSLTVPTVPSALVLANLTHLATDISGELSGHGETRPTALDLAARLHPTAAVGGTPTRVATAMIAELERAPRGRYAAPVGWVDARGDGEFAIALRCASVAGTSVRMMAGCGIVAESNPATEAREAQIKMLPIRDALEG